MCSFITVESKDKGPLRTRESMVLFLQFEFPNQLKKKKKNPFVSLSLKHLKFVPPTHFFIKNQPLQSTSIFLLSLPFHSSIKFLPSAMISSSQIEMIALAGVKARGFFQCSDEAQSSCEGVCLWVSCCSFGGS
jgi:hypothetical protein